MGNVIVFGNGTIGKRIVQVLPVYGHRPVLVVRRDGVHTVAGQRVFAFAGTGHEQVHTVLGSLCESYGIEHGMLAIPSGGDGSIEAGYITTLVDCGVSVVTAGKSALANQYDAIAHARDRIGCDAALGGGTMIPSVIKRFLDIRTGRPFVITMIINGTLNYAQSRVDDGATSEQIADEALRLGFAEPMPSGDVPTSFELYASEMGDIQRKLAVACNVCLPGLAGRSVTQHDFPVSSMSESFVGRLMAGNASYRYMVRICTHASQIGYFAECLDEARVFVQVGDLFVVGGFVRVDGALRRFIPPHAGNAVRIEQGGDYDEKRGQGAGPVPTVGAMMANLSEFAEAA